MAVFFIIAAAAAAVTAGSTAAGAGHKADQAHRAPPAARSVAEAPAPGFNAGSYTSMSDCLTAAARSGAALGACRSNE